MANETKKEVQAAIIPVCIIGSVVIESDKLTPQELGQKLGEITSSKQYLKALDNLIIVLNKLFGEAVGLDKFLITFIPSIYPVKDEEYAETVKDFTEKILSILNKSEDSK